ncbi:MAG TPA: SMC family ATPase [Candidatus Limnocylindrales bacterium]|nr:SMC family ATPase [Candidatus Limnocylindrales bacterium]
MRPLRLDMRGFAAFREATTVDFTDTDFFALVGPTGAGKSTVLDAMCFALYGTAPRWGVRSVAHALAPSANEAAVRLVFEAAGVRYAVTRVVRRDGKGRASTRAAALQALPPGFDPSTLDENDVLGEALAGTPAELDAAVPQVVGLPYDQFIKCVVLPQGEFAAFLHARPAERQEILVRLLGLDVYERVRERAAALVAEANAQLAATEQVLGELTAAASDEALADADEIVRLVTGIAAEVDKRLPGLGQAREREASLSGAVAETERRLSLLSLVRAPDDVATLAEAAQRATSAAADAAIAVGAAEEREEKVRAQLENAGDPTALTRMLDAYAERERVTELLSKLDTDLVKVRKAHGKVKLQLKQAQGAVEVATGGHAKAQEEMAAAQTADRAAWLRRDLKAGHACPVCEQTVATVPALPRERAMTAAKQRLDEAEAAVKAAQAQATKVEREFGEAEKKLAAGEARREQLDARVSEVELVLKGTATLEELKTGLKAIEKARKELGEATSALRSAREAQRRAATTAAQADDRLRKGWRDFDAARDTVAALAPPAANRDDLAVAWRDITTWAAEQACAAKEQRARLVRERDAARSEVARITSELDALFTQVGLSKPDDGGHRQDAAVAVERATAAKDQILRTREQAETLRAQRATVEAERQVATALANHLRANNFEAWLLQEALEALVAGASRILRELSNGQYDLIHDDREFFVADHHDAGLRRAVRTLSGGETFQASLALALALADQLGGVSTNASLESIMLDEGFGTLDASTLDSVAATLENLAAAGDRMVGVVTHVPSLADRIPVRFEITKDARSARVERIG